ncbi:bZIP transcription factor [Colletotrichum musicola]|uniref:BZIP transcription factor n=1 Tax=Colletotrichum musicola TaxID=2175873 RepID=A0A8H6KD09_9PEZI|nr:bZIP transcription factor [Colletotrichum musicola]
MAGRQSNTAFPIPVMDDAATRRAKKRELDRRAQRAARERNRNRIAYLEATIQAMSEQESSGRIAALVSQLADMTRQRDGLAKVLSSIETSIKVHREGEQEANASNQQQTPQPLDGTTPLDCQQRPTDHVSAVEAITLDAFNPGVPWGLPVSEGEGHVLTTTAEFPGIRTNDGGNNMPVQSQIPFALAAWDPNLECFPESPPSQPAATAHLAGGCGDGVIVPEPDSACECLTSQQCSGSPTVVATKRSIWRCANEALGTREVLSCEALAAEDEMSDDIPIRVILEGWDAVERSGGLPSLWKKLRRTDSLQFRGCPDAERLAILRLMHRLLRYQSEPTIEQCARLPAWYLSRPSQTLPHSSAIDFFVWPGVRERFVFSQHQYCSNLFWKVFAEGFRIAWPFEFRDCYRRNVVTGWYSVAPEFDERIADINSWTMSADFFGHFPEMYADIPAYQEVPRSLGWRESKSFVARSHKGRREDTEIGSSPRSRRSSGVDMVSLSTLQGWTIPDFVQSSVSQPRS